MSKLCLKNKGFTLVEIMTVVAIILILVAIVLPNFLRARRNANEFLAAKALRSISDALEMYRNDYGDYPDPPNISILKDSQPPYLVQDIIPGLDAGGGGGGEDEIEGYAGYKFVYWKYGNGRYASYAHPITPNVTGTKQFIVDEGGQVREFIEP